LLGVSSVITSSQLISKLKGQNMSFGSVEERFFILEKESGGLSSVDKVGALFSALFRKRRLKEDICDEAVILFTSGSESMPKAVPLSHRNILTNIDDVLSFDFLQKNEAFLGFLPPFHSFGLTVSILLPLLSGMRTVFYPNPTEGSMLSNLIEHYRCTLLVGTPTFLAGILRTTHGKELQSLRIAVTGAEKCPESVYSELERKCPGVIILEGYGITECSPVVSVNRPGNPVPYTIGSIMPSLEYIILDVNSSKPVEPGQKGMLYVKGKSVFSGYIKYSGEDPFVEIDGDKWYKTGDLVVEDKNGILTFAGRLKRFIKLGGEMISLPAIENILLAEYRSEDEITLAVGTEGGEENPEIVLYTVLDIERDEVNRLLKGAGFSPLYNIRRIKKVDEIPVLGTGKTDYRALESSD
ncbi:MAG: AMP-binding protein, partial [Candidatus Muiribacteriaceae bacterium]